MPANAAGRDADAARRDADAARRDADAARRDSGPWPSPPDPGDLSRRLAARRAELRLSFSQVARRAGLSPRYVEYLENFPALPGPAELRGLAVALRTTPAVLLGGGTEAAPGRVPGPAGELTPLTLAECKRLLAPGGIGRIAFPTAARLLVLPVNYAMAGGTVVLRTQSGSVIAAHGDGPVSFETDRVDEILRQAWSVLVHGQAHRVLQPGELRRLLRECDPRPWPKDDHDLYVRIIPEKITGRRLHAAGGPGRRAAGPRRPG